MSDEQQHILIHEVGHAIVAEEMGFPVTWMSLTPRGSSLGRVLHLQPAEPDCFDAAQLLNLALAGLAAEQLVFGAWLEDSAHYL